jgi:hypothetical protein
MELTRSADGLRRTHGNEATESPPQRLPLYLQGTRATRIASTGEGLLVRTAGKADRLFPFSRIGRVISRDRVQWEPSAIAECMRRAVPIVLLAGDGSVVGHIWPPVARSAPLDRVLREVFEEPEGLAHYATWLRAARMRLLNRWRARRRARGDDVPKAEFDSLVREIVYHDDDRSVQTAGRDVYEGAIAALVAEAVVRADAQARYIAHGGRTAEVATDLTRLLCISLGLELHGLGRSATGPETSLLQVLHHYAPTLKDELYRNLGSLHRRMREQVDTWR